MAMDFIGLSVGMGYTDETVIGGGALKGKNCVVSNIEEVTDGVNVTFQWTLDNGTVQTETVLLPKGTQGEAGVAGKSAYEIWLEAGNTGTEEDFLISLVGEKGADGKSAYQYAQDGGYIGTETEFTTNIARSGVISKELEVERARIDNLTTLQDGSTTGDAELLDARTDYTGKQWKNLGSHIREVSNQFSDKIVKNKNLYMNLYKNNRIEIDTTAMTISFLGTNGIFGFIYENNIINGNEYVFNFDYGVLYFLYYNEENKSIEIFTDNAKDMLRVGTFRMFNADTLELNLIDDIKTYVDGNLYGESYRTNTIGYSTEPIVFDFVNNTITFPSSFILRTNGNNYSVVNNPSISMGSWGYLGFDLKTKQIININPTQPETDEIALGVYVQNDQYAKLNGLPFTIITTTERNGNTLPDFAIFGDSIVAGVGCTLPFMYYLNIRSGVKIHNYGIGGTGYAHNIAIGHSTTIGNGSFVRGDSVNIEYANNTILDRVKDLALTLPQKYILLFGGTNDWAANKDVNIVQNAIEECITTLYDAGKVPVIILPTPRTEVVNDNGVTFSEFVDAIKESAEKYNAPLIDCYHNMGMYPINQKNRELYYGDSAGLHPNNAGHIKIGCRILDGLKNICINTDNIIGS